MSRRNAPRINWNYFFQSINSTTGKIVVITTLIGVGFTFGNFTNKFISDRELLKQEKELNDCHYSKRDCEDKLKDQAKNLEFEVNKLKYENKVLKDSIKNYGK